MTATGTLLPVNHTRDHLGATRHRDPIGMPGTATAVLSRPRSHSLQCAVFRPVTRICGVRCQDLVGRDATALRGRDEGDFVRLSKAAENYLELFRSNNYCQRIISNNCALRLDARSPRARDAKLRAHSQEEVECCRVDQTRRCFQLPEQLPHWPRMASRYLRMAKIPGRPCSTMISTGERLTNARLVVVGHLCANSR
jgi:hypothetical protein